MQEQELVVQPMDRRAKRALIAVCAAVGAVLVALIVAALVYFLPPVALTDRASSVRSTSCLRRRRREAPCSAPSSSTMTARSCSTGLSTG